MFALYSAFLLYSSKYVLRYIDKNMIKTLNLNILRNIDKINFSCYNKIIK